MVKRKTKEISSERNAEKKGVTESIIHVKYSDRKITKFIQFVCKDCRGQTLAELERQARKEGGLGFAYHFYIDNQGFVFEGRNRYAVAAPELPAYKTSIYVLIDTGDKAVTDVASKKKLLNDMQHLAYDELLEGLTAEFKDAEVSLRSEQSANT